MSKYHILKDANDYNADTENLIEISTTTNTSNTYTASLTPLTDNEIFNHLSDHHSSHNHCDSDDELFYRSTNHNREPVISGNHYTDDLIEYSNKENNNCSDKILNQQKNIYNDNNTILATGKKHKTKQFNSTFNSVNATFAVTAADTCDDTIMEIPLLQPNNMNENGTGNNGDITKNYNNKQHHQYDFECVCLCQQRGFASHLNSNSTQTAKSKILWAIALCCIFMIVEFLGGYIAGSLAIMTDAAHLASDCISFIIGLVAIWLGTRPPDAKMSFGYKRFEVMGAIVSILGIWILTATLVLVAIQRIYSNDYDLDANTMMTISGIGILINIIMIFILHTSILDLPAGNIGGSHCHSHSHSHSHSQSHNSHHGHSQGNIHAHTTTLLHRRRHSNDNDHMHTDISTRSLLPTNSDAESDGVVAIPSAAIDTDEATSIELSSAPILFNGNLSKHQQDGNEKNLNLRAAMIHVIGDLVQSIGVFVASVLIKIFPKAVFLDPLCTLFFSVIVIMTTINLFKESMHLIMDAVPKGISLEDLEMDLLSIEGVKSVHHLNVWDHTSNYSILMVHLVTDILTEGNTILMKATQLAGSSKYNIKHSTIQIETVTS